jgi:hypothetical protein
MTASNANSARRTGIAIASASLFVAAAAVAFFSNPPGSSVKQQAVKNVSVKQAAPAKPYKAPIEPYAIKPYTAAGGYAETVAKYGPRLAELQAYRIKAANAAAANEACDKVIMSEISTMRGGLNDMHFWVDCENGTRFRFSESELDANAAAVSESDKALTQDQAQDRCRQLINDAATHPSTVRINWLSGSYGKFNQTGATEYRVKFSAKNSFNTELQFAARCLFQTDGGSELTVQEQQG